MKIKNFSSCIKKKLPQIQERTNVSMVIFLYSFIVTSTVYFCIYLSIWSWTVPLIYDFFFHTKNSFPEQGIIE